MGKKYSLDDMIDDLSNQKRVKGLSKKFIIRVGDILYNYEKRTISSQIEKQKKAEMQEQFELEKYRDGVLVNKKDRKIFKKFRQNNKFKEFLLYTTVATVFSGMIYLVYPTENNASPNIFKSGIKISEIDNKIKPKARSLSIREYDSKVTASLKKSYFDFFWAKPKKSKSKSKAVEIPSYDGFVMVNGVKHKLNNQVNGYLNVVGKYSNVIGDSRNEIVVASYNKAKKASKLSVYSNKGYKQFDYDLPGKVTSLLTFNLDDKGIEELIIGGCKEENNIPFVAVKSVYSGAIVSEWEKTTLEDGCINPKGLKIRNNLIYANTQSRGYEFTKNGKYPN